jgi:hypothetical protein
MNKWLLVVVFLFLATVAHASEKSAPEEFGASIGGFLGQSYWVSLEGNAIEYSSSTSTGIVPKDKLVFHPTEAEWSTFKKMLDEANIWKWKKRYVNSSVQDGTQWSLQIKWAKRSKTSSGNNAFPDKKNFDEFLKAVQVLIKGNEFH